MGILDVLGGDPESLPDTLRAIVASVGLPTSLHDVGVTVEAVPEMAEVVLPDTRHLSVNPREMKLEDIEHVFREAF